MTELTLPPGSRAGAHAAPTARLAPVPPLHPALNQAFALLATFLSVLALMVLLGFPSPHSTPGVDARGAILALFWLVGPGAAIARLLPVPAAAKVALVPLLGLGLLTASGTVGAWTGVWIPRTSAIVIVLITLVLAASSFHRQSILLPSGAVRRPGRLPLTIGAALAAAVILWALAIHRIPSANPSVLGLLVSGPWMFQAAVGVLVVALVLALRNGRAAPIGATALALVLVLRTTVAAASSVPSPVSAYKHIGIVEALEKLHHVLGGTDIYMNWPGMFGASAYFSDSSGVAAIDVARWFPPMVHLIIALETATLARVFGARAAGCATAAALVVVFNWVGQDYFSPQALAMCLASGVLVLLVQSRANRTSGVLTLLVYAVIVPTHQLTPFWLLGLAFVLMLLRRTPWWVVLGMAAMAGGYLWAHYDAVASYGLFSGFNVLSNASSNVAPVPALGRDVAGWFAKGTAALMWVSTLAVLLVRLRRSGCRAALRPDGAAVPFVIAFSPFALVAGQAYGGEAGLRVTLYSVVGCAAILGPALVRMFRGTAVTVAAGVAWTVVALGATTMATFSPWFLNYIQPQDVAASKWLAEEHENAFVISVTQDWPGRGWSDPVAFRKNGGGSVSLDSALRQAAYWTHRPLDQSLPLSWRDLLQVAAARSGGAPTYVVFTGSMKAYDDYYDTFTPGSYEQLRESLQGNSSWKLARHKGNLWVFQFVGRGAGGR